MSWMRILSAAVLSLSVVSAVSAEEVLVAQLSAPAAAPSARPAGSPAKASDGKSVIDWVKIPGGAFMMGEGTDKHKVSIEGFEMARTLTTNRQYAACVAAGACTPADACGHQSGGEDRPVVCVDWYQARQFAEWAGGRLPSEAEFEYAARSAGKDKKYPWGDKEASCDNAVLNAGCGRYTLWNVCSKPAGNTEQGLCDMAGNAWEWTADYYHPTYQGAPADGTAWIAPATVKRVFRGGSWSSEPVDVRAATRDHGDPALRICDLGFRVVRGGRPAPAETLRARSASAAPAKGGATPHWAHLGTGAFRHGFERTFAAVGRGKTAEDADDNARAEMAKLMEEYVASFTKPYMDSQPVSKEYGSSESQSQHVGQTLRNFARFTRHDVQVPDRWTDAKSGLVLSHATIDMKAFRKRLDESRELDPLVRGYMTANAEKRFDLMVKAPAATDE